jgi:hypothetical protein
MEKLSDTTKEAQQVLADIYRRMTPVEKFHRIFQAYQMGKLLAMAGLRIRNPGADKGQLWRLRAKQHLGEKLFNEVYGIHSVAGSRRKNR